MLVRDAPLAAGLKARGFAARYVGHTVIAIGAHPDDIELGIGGTVALLTAAGVQVVMAIVSVPADYAVRVAEATDSAAILDCKLRVLLEGECRRIEDLKNYQPVGMVDALVREYRPAAVLAHGPTDFHRDHVQVYHAAVAAQRLAQFDLYSYLPTMCRPVPVPFQPRAYVDISATIETKMRAIAAHRSQFYSRGLTFDFYREMARLNGRLVGVEYAEGLEVSKMLFA